MIILYQAYGSKSSYQQAVFSILTLYHYLQGDFDGYKIIVYTDEPKYFLKYNQAIPIIVEQITSEMLVAFKGPLNFSHRAKICILKDCFTRYNSDIFYLDADTYFTQSPVELFQKLQPGTAIMNSNDYDLIEAEEIFEDSNWLRIRRVIKDHSYTLANRTFKIPLTTRMWNAGVIGLSYKDRKLLEDVMDLSDQIYKYKKVFTAEQFAFSYVLQNTVNLISSGEVIFHYWPDFAGKQWKQTYNFHFRLFFHQNKGMSLKEQATRAVKLAQQHDYLKLPGKSFIERLYHRLSLVMKVAYKGRIY
ncbi:hypothetical protein Q4E40_16615 [Pontibacter sp. BT731]|uniref:hypothetical protein n=1 Tax=Pontibacter coccineus TaxID=3063328 RepID=UPI0026E23E03|nr:hypothetical protein [Pontibacter sp. BT731]MDO6391761.1 hypothetical protein [Pontibacter sp. BT731]